MTVCILLEHDRLIRLLSVVVIVVLSLIGWAAIYLGVATLFGFPFACAWAAFTAFLANFVRAHELSGAR